MASRPTPAASPSAWTAWPSPCSTPTAPTLPPGPPGYGRSWTCSRRSRPMPTAKAGANGTRPVISTGKTSVIHTKVRCREITESDVDAVADLLTRGFVGRSRGYWIQGLRRLAVRPVPAGSPGCGYMLDNDGTPVGLLLLIYTARTDGDETAIQCNLSS